jgi:hypothetical protein
MLIHRRAFACFALLCLTLLLASCASLEDLGDDYPGHRIVRKRQEVLHVKGGWLSRLFGDGWVRETRYFLTLRSPGGEEKDVAVCECIYEEADFNRVLPGTSRAP